MFDALYLPWYHMLSMFFPLWLIRFTGSVARPAPRPTTSGSRRGYIFIPKLRPEHGWLMGACMIVEATELGFRWKSLWDFLDDRGTVPQEKWMDLGRENMFGTSTWRL